MENQNSSLQSSSAFRFVKKHLSSLIKIAVSVIGLAYVLWKIPAEQIKDELTIVSWPWLLITFLLMTLSLVLRAFRWSVLLKGLNAEVRFGRLVELYFVGNFFNAFLPSGFGGDAVRIYESARDVPANVAAGTVIVDRLTGLLALFMMALLVLPFRPEQFPNYLAIFVATVCIVGLMVGAAIFQGDIFRKLVSLLPARLSSKGEELVSKLFDAIQGCGRKAIIIAFGVSIIFNLILVAWWESASRALGYDIPYSYLLLVVPILSVALLVPSISGLGVRELLAGPLFSAAGLANAQAVALSLTVWLVMRATSLLGAPIYIVATLRENRRSRTKPAEQAAES